MNLEPIIQAVVRGLGINPEILIAKANELQATLGEFIALQHKIVAGQEELLARFCVIEDQQLELLSRIAPGERERQMTLLALGADPSENYGIRPNVHGLGPDTDGGLNPFYQTEKDHERGS